MRYLAILLVLAAPAAADPLDDALTEAGFRRADLGWTPRGWWQRFPRGVTHKLDHFDDLFAEPLATVPFVRVMGRAARDLLSAEGLAAKPTYGAHSLYRFVHIAGINRRFGGIRPYSPNLTAEPTPLDEAVLALYRYAGRQTRFVTFDQESPYPQIGNELKAAAAKLPPETSRVLGRLVLNVVDAHRWADLAFRRVKLEDRVAVCRRLDLGMESVDALEYAPACDDVAAEWDEASLWYAAGKCVEALDAARRELAAMKHGAGVSFDWETPLGWIRVRGAGEDEIDASDALLVVDLGGNDVYTGAAGASSATRPLGLCLDLEGNDRYAAARVAHGVGMCGVGMLVDAAGKDAYRLHGDGQGFGGVGGVGVLADRTGDDTYFAEPDGPASGRPSYHSQGKIAVSNAQGCAMGRRGDGADGHNWAGGLGALLDVEGQDRYSSGNWSMGTGYWFGMGALWDGGGNDAYDGHVWSQATGAHFCIGVLIDEGGNDRHTGRQNNSLAFGHDFTICLLLNEGGDDVYETPAEGLGFSINRSVAMLVDTGGNDTYRAKNAPGFARFDKRFADRNALSTYWVDASSLGLFLDVGGKDKYAGRDRNGTTWTDPPDSDNRRTRNVGLGRDVADGAIDWAALPAKGRR